jgi:hypothetical protein
MKKTNYYKLSGKASMLSKSLTRFRRMLKKALLPAEPRDGFNEDEWFFSNVEVAQFFCCSERTIMRLKKQGKISCITHGHVCLFKIATLLHVIANDEQLAALFTRKRPARRPKKAPVARYNTFIRKGWLWIAVRFLGKDMTIVINSKEWSSVERIAEFVKEVISYRLSSKSSKSTGLEKN